MRPLALLALLPLLVPVPARAEASEDPPEPPESAEDAQAIGRAYFEQGVAAFQERRYKDAIDLFLQADKHRQSATLSFNIAKAYENLGDDAGALQFYRSYLRRAPDASDREQVESTLAQLEQQLSNKGVQQVSVFSTPAAATVVLDGQPVGVTPWTGEIPAGRHSVRLLREGYEEAQKTFELLRHRAMDVELTLRAAAVARPPPTPSRLATDPVDDDWVSAISSPTWIAFGVGAAAFGGALVFEQLRANAADAVRHEPTQLGRADRAEEMDGYQTSARIFVGVGAAAAVVGGVLLYLDLAPADPASSQGGRVGLGCSGSLCGAVMRGSF